MAAFLFFCLLLSRKHFDALCSLTVEKGMSKRALNLLKCKQGNKSSGWPYRRPPVQHHGSHRFTFPSSLLAAQHFLPFCALFLFVPLDGSNLVYNGATVCVLKGCLSVLCDAVHALELVSVLTNFPLLLRVAATAPQMLAFPRQAPAGSGRSYWSPSPPFLPCPCS